MVSKRQVQLDSTRSRHPCAGMATARLSQGAPIPTGSTLDSARHGRSGDSPRNRMGLITFGSTSCHPSAFPQRNVFAPQSNGGLHKNVKKREDHPTRLDFVREIEMWCSLCAVFGAANNLDHIIDLAESKFVRWGRFHAHSAAPKLYYVQRRYRNYRNRMPFSRRNN